MALDPNKVFEAQSGFRVLDGATEGPIYTGGPVSPVGLDFPVGSFYVQNNATGAVIWRKWGASLNDWIKASPVDFYQTASAPAETSTTSNLVWSTKLTLVTPTLPAGDYRLGWRYKWRTGVNKQLDFRIRNGTDLFTSRPSIVNADEGRADAGFLPLIGISGGQTFNMEFKLASVSLGAIYMSDAYFEFWRVN